MNLEHISMIIYLDAKVNNVLNEHYMADDGCKLNMAERKKGVYYIARFESK